MQTVPIPKKYLLLIESMSQFWKWRFLEVGYATFDSSHCWSGDWIGAWMAQVMESVATYVILILFHLLEIQSMRREQFSSPSRDRVGRKCQWARCIVTCWSRTHGAAPPGTSSRKRNRMRKNCTAGLFCLAELLYVFKSNSNWKK